MLRTEPGWESDQLTTRLSCIDTATIPFTLISTLGFHCDVWRTSGTHYRGGEARPVDCVVKIAKRGYGPAELRVLARDYRTLSSRLEEITPRAQFIHALVDGRPSAVVLAEACPPWFDLANPANAREALPLLRDTRRARDQLARFTRAARSWLDESGRLIDLCGRENLVLDRQRTIRYLDSFHTFLYPDLLHLVDDPGESLAARIDISVSRLSYLEGLVTTLGRQPLPGPSPSAGPNLPAEPS